MQAFEMTSLEEKNLSKYTIYLGHYNSIDISLNRMFFLSLHATTAIDQ